MESLQKAIGILGGQSHLAAQLGVVQSAVAGWIKRGAVPVKYCPGIERITQGEVTRRDLRPDDWQDIWPELAASTPTTAGQEVANA
jgi:DNA-binding transcriptional regulator YdaS (Cro superfamily)